MNALEKLGYTRKEKSGNYIIYEKPYVSKSLIRIVTNFDRDIFRKLVVNESVPFSTDFSMVEIIALDEIIKKEKKERRNPNGSKLANTKGPIQPLPAI